MGIRMHEFCDEYKLSKKEAVEIFTELGYKLKPHSLSAISTEMEKKYIAYLKDLQKELNASDKTTVPGKKNLFNIVKTWLSNTKTRIAQIRAVRSEDVESTKAKPGKVEQNQGTPLREVAKTLGIPLKTVHHLFHSAGVDTVKAQDHYKVSKKELAVLKKFINNTINSL